MCRLTEIQHCTNKDLEPVPKAQGLAFSCTKTMQDRKHGLYTARDRKGIMASQGRDQRERPKGKP
jgi:hypothetical protein